MLSGCRLRKRNVQIWIGHFDALSAEEIEHLFGTLDASERERTSQFRSKRDRHRYIAAHGLLRLVLAETLGRPATTLVFEKSVEGKPELRQSEHGQGRLKFNLSHSELPADAAPFDVPSAKRPAERGIVQDLSVPMELTAALAIAAC
jgi:hypothetical protein